VTDRFSWAIGNLRRARGDGEETHRGTASSLCCVCVTPGPVAWRATRVSRNSCFARTLRRARSSFILTAPPRSRPAASVAQQPCRSRLFPRRRLIS